MDTNAHHGVSANRNAPNVVGVLVLRCTLDQSSSCYTIKVVIQIRRRMHLRWLFQECTLTMASKRQQKAPLPAPAAKKARKSRVTMNACDISPRFKALPITLLSGFLVIFLYRSSSMHLNKSSGQRQNHIAQLRPQL